MKIYWVCDRCLKHGECEMEPGKELEDDYAILDRAHKAVSPTCDMPLEHIGLSQKPLSEKGRENLEKLAELEQLRGTDQPSSSEP